MNLTKVWCALALVLSCTLTLSYGQCDPVLQTDSAEILFDGPVNKMDAYSHYMYAAGAFSTVGKFTGSFIEIDKKNGTTVNRAAWPKANGNTIGAIPDGTGRLIVFGSFTKMGDSTRSSLAIINASGNVSSLNLTIDNSVNAAVVYNGILYIGGYFTKVNGVTRNRLAAINLTTGLLMSWDPNIINTIPAGLPARIECMMLDNGIIYVGGAFNRVGVTNRRNIAAITPAGVVTAWAPEAYFTTSPDYGVVNKMLKVNNLMYICGQFDYTGGAARPDVAALDMTVGIATNWAPNPDSRVYTLAAQGDTLYLGGVFTQISGQPRNSFAAYRISTGALLPLIIDVRRKMTDKVYAILPIGDSLYIGGSFDTIANQFRKNLACFNRQNGFAYPWKSHTNDEVSILLQDNGKLYAGGNFFSAGRKEKMYVAEIDLDADTVTNRDLRVNDVVSAMSIINGTMYIGGSFTKVGDSLRNYNAAIDLKHNSVTTWNIQANTGFRTIARYKNEVYIGGDFAAISGQPRNGIAKLDTNGNLLPWIGIAGFGGVVNALELINDTLFAGGVFNNLAGQPRANMGAVNLLTGVATSWNPVNHVEVHALCHVMDTLYVAGQYNLTYILPLQNLNPPTVITGQLEIIYSYDLLHRKNFTMDFYSLFLNGFITQIAATPAPGGRMYVAGGFTDIQAVTNNKPYTDTRPLRSFCILEIPVPKPLLLGGPGQPPPPYSTKLRDFNADLQSGPVNTFYFTGNKLFLGGSVGVKGKPYQNAALFLRPDVMLSATTTTDTNGVCSGTKTTLRTSSTVTYGARYKWYVNGMLMAASEQLPHFTFTPSNKDTVTCIVSSPATTCQGSFAVTTSNIIYTVTPTVHPAISITSLIAKEQKGNSVTVKASVKDAATGYSIEWFNKGVSIGKTSADSIVYTKAPGKDSIYAVITPRPDTCYVTDTSSGIVIEEEIVVGIKQTKGDAAITVYPNPFSNYIQISGLNTGDVILVYDITGRKLSADVTTQSEYVLQTSKLNAGTYIVKISDSGGAQRKSLLLQKH